MARVASSSLAAGDLVVFHGAPRRVRSVQAGAGTTPEGDTIPSGSRAVYFNGARPKIFTDAATLLRFRHR